MSDFIDATQEYSTDTGGSTTTITNISNNDLLAPPIDGSPENLIKLVNSALNINNLYILQTNTNGEIRFLTKDAYLNNDVSANNGNQYYNVKIGKDGKLYCYYTYNFLTNPLRISGWYDIVEDIAGQAFQITGLEVSSAGFTATLIGVGADILTIQGLVAINTSGISSLALRVSKLEAFTQIGSVSLNESTQINIDDALLTLSNGIAEFEAVGSIPTQASRVLATTRYAYLTQQVAENAIGAIGLIGFVVATGVGIRAILDNQKKQEYQAEMLGLADTLSKIAISATADRLIHTGISITSGNTGFTTNGTYRITIQRSAVILIKVSSLVASVINVEQFGVSTFAIAETISITKTQLGGGTGGNLVLSVAVLGTLKEWTELRATYLQEKIDGIDTKGRRKGGVIGADDIDTTQFTTTNISYTDTTSDINNETITYKQLKSRLNLLPTGTSDVDVYTSTGKVGIGTTPSVSLGLHIYEANDSGIVIQSGTSGISSIQFIRGVSEDDLVDFRLVNTNNLFRLQHQVIIGGTATQFGDGNSYLMDISTTKTQFYKDLQIDGKVGINTTPHATINLDTNGSARLTGNVGIGTTPAVSGDSYEPQLKIYSAGDTSISLRGATANSSGIEFGRGSRTDATPDFRIINQTGYNGLVFQFQDNSITYGDAQSELLLLKPAGSTFYTSFQVDNFVGIGTSFDNTGANRLRVNGTTKITNGDLYLPDGRMGIGTLDPQSPLDVVGNINISSGSKYKINDADLSYNDLTNKLTAGTGIAINALTNEITATGGGGATYTAGDGIAISGANAISLSSTINNFTLNATLQTATLPPDLVFTGTIPITFTLPAPLDTLNKCYILDYRGVGTSTSYSFTIPAGGMIIDFLMVGGGGCGGKDMGAGGGGGAMMFGTNLYIDAGTYSASIGRGGQSSLNETKGRDTSCFNAGCAGGGSAPNVAYNGYSYSNQGGGGAGGTSVANGNNYSAVGGLGGIDSVFGGSYRGNTLTKTTLYAGQAGGTGVNTRAGAGTGQICSAGGGGPTSFGGNGQTTTAIGTGTAPSNGGTGFFNNILGTNYAWGGGGGGGSTGYLNASTGGAGGGGGGQNANGAGATSFGAVGGSTYFTGGTGATALNGVNGTGGGGGGVGLGTTLAGNGGSGIVIIRYRNPKKAQRYIETNIGTTPALRTFRSGMVDGNYKLQQVVASTGVATDVFNVEEATGDLNIGTYTGGIAVSASGVAYFKNTITSAGIDIKNGGITSDNNIRLTGAYGYGNILMTGLISNNIENKAVWTTNALGTTWMIRLVSMPTNWYLNIHNLVIWDTGNVSGLSSVYFGVWGFTGAFPYEGILLSSAVKVNNAQTIAVSYGVVASVGFFVITGIPIGTQVLWRLT